MCRIGRHVMWHDLSLRTAWIQRKQWNSLRMLLGVYVKRIHTGYFKWRLKDFIDRNPEHTSDSYGRGGGCGGGGGGGEAEGVKWEP